MLAPAQVHCSSALQAGRVMLKEGETPALTRSAPRHGHGCRGSLVTSSMLRSRPGEDFYTQRLERARALPEAERSPDVRGWLAAHDALDAAAAALPELQPGAALTEPAGGSAALAALLQFLVLSFCHAPADPIHPAFSDMHLFNAQLPPLFLVQRDSGGTITSQPTPLLGGILRTLRLPPGGENLVLVTRTLLWAYLRFSFYANRQIRHACDAASSSASPV